MKYQYKKFAGVLKKRLLQMKQRGWIHSYCFYSNTCVTVWFDNPLQEKWVKRLRYVMTQHRFDAKDYSNCINFNLIDQWNWTKYECIAKLWLRRLVKP